jgi:hypothetical protein
METSTRVDQLLSSESSEYKHVAQITRYLNETDDIPHRHIFDVMRHIKSVIPEHIFHRYEHSYLWLINDCAFKAPEAFFICWGSLVEILINIEHAYPNEPFIEKMKAIFSGQNK